MKTHELKTVQSRVERVLELVPEARNDDKLLMELYLATYHGITTFKQYRQSKDAPALGSIDRFRRMFQAKGKYKADQVIEDGRAENEAVCEQYFRR